MPQPCYHFGNELVRRVLHVTAFMSRSILGTFPDLLGHLGSLIHAHWQRWTAFYSAHKQGCFLRYLNINWHFHCGDSMFPGRPSGKYFASIPTSTPQKQGKYTVAIITYSSFAPHTTLLAFRRICSNIHVSECIHRQYALVRQVESEILIEKPGKAH